MTYYVSSGTVKPYTLTHSVYSGISHYAVTDNNTAMSKHDGE